MADHRKETQKECSPCFEGMPFAELMGKMIAGQGVGSLCTEMMQKIIDPKGTGDSFDCAKVMERMMTMCRGIEKEEEKTPKE